MVAEQKNKLYKRHYKTLIETSRGHAAVYRHALKALFLIIKQDFQINEEMLAEPVQNDFLGSLNIEMSVERIVNE